MFSRKSEVSKELITNLAIIVAIIIVALIPLIFTPNFYYLDDTQRAAVGQWYEVGRLITNHQLPIFNVGSQGSGNFLAEGQWGTFSPLIWLMSVTIYHTSNYLVTITIFKIIALIIFGVSFRKLMQVYGVSDKWAFVGGLTVPMMGFTIYAGGSSWVTDLFVSALWPLFWWLLMRFLDQGKSPIWVFLSGYTIITIGYISGTIMIVAIMLGVLIASLVAKNYRRLINVILLGITLGLTTIAVYWPGMQIASVTLRTSGIINDNFFVPSIKGLLVSFFPSFFPNISTWWSAGNGVTYMPLMYISWIIFVLAFLDWKAVRYDAVGTVKRGINYNLLIPFGISLLLLLAPGQLGPLRFPMRNMAYIGQFVILFVGIFLTKYDRYLKLTKRTSIQATIVMFIAFYLSWAQTPERARTLLIAAVVVLFAVGLVVWLSSKERRGGLRWLFVVMVVVTTAGVAFTQHYYDKRVQIDTAGQRRATLYKDFNLPMTKQGILKYSKNFSGDSIVLGKNTNTIVGNDWYVAERSSWNVYSPVGFRKFSDDLRGGDPTFIGTDKYTKLFSLDKTTGVPVADLLSIDTVQLFKDDTGVKAYNAVVKKGILPEGWHLVSHTRQMFIIQRDTISPKAGGVVWSNHAGVETEKNATTTVKIHVPANSTSTKVVLSRLNWPGYSVSGNSKLIKPLRGYLVQIKVPASERAQTITLEYNAPGLKLSILSIVMAVLIMIVWLAIRIRIYFKH